MKMYRNFFYTLALALIIGAQKAMAEVGVSSGAETRMVETVGLVTISDVTERLASAIGSGILILFSLVTLLIGIIKAIKNRKDSVKRKKALWLVFFGMVGFMITPIVYSIIYHIAQSIIN